MGAAQLRSWRKSKRWTQAELARRAGVSMFTVHFLEDVQRGQTPKPETRERLARALGITRIELAGFPPKAGEPGRMPGSAKPGD